MKNFFKIGIIFVLAIVIGGAAFYYVNLEKVKRIADAFSSPKEGQVYILNNGNIYYGYQITRISTDGIYCVAGKIYANGYNYEKMRETKNFFSGDTVKFTKEELNTYLHPSNGAIGLYDITEVEEQ